MIPSGQNRAVRVAADLDMRTPLPRDLREGLSQSHLPGLDGLRMVAVFTVVFYHLGFQGSPGGHGVLAFFVLSGFLITWLLLKEEEAFGKISLRLFYIRRALRIFPAFYCFWILITGYLLVFDKPILWSQATSSLMYVANYYQAIFGDPNTPYSHTWSLGVEEQFYLLWPLCFIALSSNSRRWTALAALIAVVWIYRLLLVFAIGVDQGYVYEAFDTRADHLAVGCLLAVSLRAGRLPRLWAWLCHRTMSIATLTALIVSIRLSQIYGAEYRDAIGFAVDPLLVAVLIAQVIALRISRLWQWLNWRWVRYLGALSYSIYLYHGIGTGLAQKIAASYPSSFQIGAALVAVIALASASYHLIEQPFLRLKKFASPLATGTTESLPDAARIVQPFASARK
jgi:peptidoglycan/LPS O-acetylase OafA/YrhL